MTLKNIQLCNENYFKWQRLEKILNVAETLTLSKFYASRIYIFVFIGYFSCFTCKKHGPLTSLQENFETLIKTKGAK